MRIRIDSGGKIGCFNNNSNLIVIKGLKQWEFISQNEMQVPKIHLKGAVYNNSYSSGKLKKTLSILKFFHT